MPITTIFMVLIANTRASSTVITSTTCTTGTCIMSARTDKLKSTNWKSQNRTRRLAPQITNAAVMKSTMFMGRAVVTKRCRMAIISIIWLMAIYTIHMGITVITTGRSQSLVDADRPGRR